ncbi:MAG: LysM peptidoglycan-binding domain-containing protein [Negativicoccus succinicivorans]|uniref:LysM peptidoglycan-binding domain-containing protein n=1 Tax=Negativicoccus succinicivorans TaxID=620903 RepID=UPI0026EEFFB7|nr:LysM peptidoglycan-binding domain-containing protein [Negativicoccus succinicivorans]MBS6028435.1 LysM peptidoglycan-binding domain-containing protein [Negativicoccus succinicivorans]
MTKTMSSAFIKLGILMTFVVAGWMHFMSSKPVSQVYYQPIRIQTGDTLWKIASQYAPAHKDIREVVYEIQSYNHLVDAGTLRPGMIIHIPVETSSINDEMNIAVK